MTSPWGSTLNIHKMAEIALKWAHEVIQMASHLEWVGIIFLEIFTCEHSIIQITSMQHWEPVMGRLGVAASMPSPVA